jgi:hypothetical protein
MEENTEVADALDFPQLSAHETHYIKSLLDQRKRSSVIKKKIKKSTLKNLELSERQAEHDGVLK